MNDLDEVAEALLDCGTGDLSFTAIGAKLTSVDNQTNNLFVGAPTPSNDPHSHPHVQTHCFIHIRSVHFAS